MPPHLVVARVLEFLPSSEELPLATTGKIQRFVSSKLEDVPPVLPGKKKKNL